jgi:putative aldouronate transport system substrate-binding protein
VNNIIPGYLDGTKVNGRLLGVSGLYSKASSDYWVYRADLAQKYGMDTSNIKSIDDIEAQLLKLKEPGMAALLGNATEAEIIPWADGNYLMGSWTNPVRYDTLGDSQTGLAIAMFSDPSKVINFYKTDIYKAGLTKARELYQKGLVYKDAAINTEMPEELMKAGKGFSVITSGELGIDAMKTSQVGYPVKSVKIMDNSLMTTAMTRFVWIVPSFSKKAPAALKFLNLMLTREDISNLLTWGIQGRDWVLNKDGTASYPTGVTAQNVKYHAEDFLWGNQYLIHPWAGNDPNLRAATLKQNQGMAKSPLLGFSYDSAPIQNELSSIYNVIKQYRPALQSGSVDPNTELPKFIKALDDAGAQKVIDTVQSQLTTWLAANKK